MDDIDIEEFELQTDEKPVEIIPDGGIQTEEEVVKWEDVFADYLSLPTKAIYTFSTLTERQRYDACGAGWKKFFTTYKIAGEPPKLDVINESFKARHKHGWNSGLFCRTITDVNKALAFYGQCEFIPAMADGNKNIYWCSKVNYQSLPIVPGNCEKLRAVSAFFSVGKTGLTAKQFPDNFTNAVVTSNNKKWRGSNFALAVLKTATTYCSQPHQAAIYIGEVNAEKYTGSIADFDPTSARKIVPASTRSPSILSNCIPQYLELFAVVGRDEFGPVSTERMLASHYDGDGFYGHCSGVTLWLTKTTIIKCQNVPASIINHTLQDFYNNASWPARCIMYACTPQDITTYTSIHGKPPKAVVLPFQAAIGGGKHIQALVQSCAKVRILVHFAATPLVSFVTEGAKDGFNTNSLVSNLAALEKEVIVKLLEIMKDQLLFKPYSLSWECKPTDTYGPSRCHVKWVEVTTPMLYCRQVYMSSKDLEKAMFLPTGHASEIQVNGKKVSHVADEGIAANYKRANPPFVAKSALIFKPGVWYDEDGIPLATQPKRPDLFKDVKQATAVLRPLTESTYQMVPQAVGAKIEEVMRPVTEQIVHTKAGYALLDAKRNISFVEASMKANEAGLAEIVAGIDDAIKAEGVRVRKAQAALRTEQEATKDEVAKAAIQLDYNKLTDGLAKFIKDAQKHVAEETDKYEEDRQVNKLTLKELNKKLGALKKAARHSEREAFNEPVVPEEKKDEEPEEVPVAEEPKDAPVAEEKAYQPDDMDD